MFGTAAPKSCTLLCLSWDGAGLGDVEVGRFAPFFMVQPVEFAGSCNLKGWSQRLGGGGQGLPLCFTGVAPAESTNFVFSCRIQLLNGPLACQELYNTEAKLGMEVCRCTLKYYMPDRKLQHIRTLPPSLPEPSMCHLYFEVYKNIHTLTSFPIPFKTNPFESDLCNNKIPSRSKTKKTPNQQQPPHPLQTIIFCLELKTSSFT